MSMIGKIVLDFKVEAFHENSFKTITKQDTHGKWGVFFFYPADFTFVCPTELEDLASKYEELKCLIVKYTQFRAILILFTRRGTMLQTQLKESNSQCLLIRQVH